MSGASQALAVVFTRAPRMIGRRIADEFVLVPLAGRGAEIDALYNLNRVGAFIWEQLDGRRDGHALVRALVGRFDVDEARAQADYLNFVAQLESIQAITRADKA
jgi:hypothetical protein